MYISLSLRLGLSLTPPSCVHSGQRLTLHMEYGQEEHLEFLGSQSFQTKNNFFQTNQRNDTV
jgi:hypothetical protein